jgi:hypothetical protein
MGGGGNPYRSGDDSRPGTRRFNHTKNIRIFKQTNSIERFSEFVPDVVPKQKRVNNKSAASN